MILETAIDRLLPMETSSLFDGYGNLMHHQLGEHATHPIARFSGRPALSRLAGRPENEVSVEANVSEANVKRSGRSQKRTLGRVQSPFLG